MRILSFDIESCTGNPYDGSLCSFGYVLTENGKIVETDDLLCNPLPKHFTLGKWGQEPALKLAYSVDTFRSSPRFNRSYPRIKALFARCDFAIGFSVGNDLKYLNNACDKFSLERINYKFLDVQLLAGLVFPEIKNLGLKAPAEKFGIVFLAHRSDEDARVTLAVFEKIISFYGKPFTEFLNDFDIKFGVNNQNGHVGCYSLYAVNQRIETGSKAVKKLIFSGYKRIADKNIETENSLLKGKYIGVSEKITSENTELTGKLVATVYRAGGRFSDRDHTADIIVAEKGDASINRLYHAKTAVFEIITPEKFFEKYGLSEYPFDNTEALLYHYTEVISDREEPKQEALLHTRAANKNDNTQIQSENGK